MILWIRKHGLLLFGACLAIILGGLVVLRNPPESKQCALCGLTDRYHAPVLMNLSTGEIGALHVYHPSPASMAELAEDQPADSYRVVSFCGVQGCYDWCHSCQVVLPEKPKPMRATLFCKDCRARLAEAAGCGYAVLDLYDLSDIQIYPVVDGAEYTIRDYTVSANFKGNADRLHIFVTGNHS